MAPKRKPRAEDFSEDEALIDWLEGQERITWRDDRHVQERLKAMKATMAERIARALLRIDVDR